MDNWLEQIVNNKTWIFSGIGVFVPGLIGGIFQWKRTHFVNQN